MFDCTFLAQPPTPVPTPFPTPSPVEINNDKFLLFNVWNTADCSGTPVEIETYNLGYCFPTADVGVYLRWTLSETEYEYQLKTTYYTDNSCETVSTTDTPITNSYPSTCTSAGGDGIYVSAQPGDLPDGEYVQYR